MVVQWLCLRLLTLKDQAPSTATTVLPEIIIIRYLRLSVYVRWHIKCSATSVHLIPVPHCTDDQAKAHE